MRLLIIAEKPSIKKVIEDGFEKIKDSIDYDIDVVTAVCFVTSNEDANQFHIDTKDFRSFSLKSREVPENYKIITDMDYHKIAEERIASLIRDNKYDLVVNACDPDTAGELMFDFTRETCGLLDYKTINLYLEGFYSEYYYAEFLKLGHKAKAIITEE